MSEEKPAQEYLFPQDPSGEVVRPPGRVGVALAEEEVEVLALVMVVELMVELEADEVGGT